ncbi:MAG: bifunctional YncE family protein/alkaline phosphatase family protein [Bacteroidota bacterium]|nr:bifunctional YncE family protein/alkaline phosphatase family protein [Bacteroidota bacterium]
MKKIFSIFFIFFSAFLSSAQTLQQLEAKKTLLPNGWSLTPAGRSFALQDLPLNIAVSSSKKYIAVTNNGYSKQYIQLIDVRKEKVVDSIVIPRSWLGLKFSADENYLYAAAGTNNMILKYALHNNKLRLLDSIILGTKWPNKIWPTGIEIDDINNLMYIVTKENNSLYVINLTTKKTLQIIKMQGEGYTCLLSPDKRQLYISCWGCDKVLIYDTQIKKFFAEINVGSHPNDMCLTRNGKFLFVANANDNSISVIDVAEQKIIETLNCALYPNSPTGSTTNSVALSADKKVLYVANADNNCLAVFDVSKPGMSAGKGFIPVGWYPTCVRIIDKKIFVSNGKGFFSMPNPYGPQPVNTKQIVMSHLGDSTNPPGVQDIRKLFKGTMSVIDIPSEKQMDVYTKAVYSNTPYNREKEITADGEKGNPIPKKIGESSPIKYVFYIIKENRTYDQVLGDIKEGNGDENLCLFPEKISPNHHALAKEFVLLDNFYVDAEVSPDGHNWSTAAYATDYVEKGWPTNYSKRGSDYDFEGENPLSRPAKGYIWDHLYRAGVSFRTYAEFVGENGKPHIPVLKGHICEAFGTWNLSVKDTTRLRIWQNDFDSLSNINAVPHFSSIHLMCDHTEGVRKGKPTPFAHVADNDLALGMLVEHLSKSAIWKESAVFVLEDDAQNGPDHVDAHRSIAFVAGGLVKRHYVDHTMYSTSSMLRTIELILGIAPMSQYDAAAEPMWRCFTNKADLTPYTVRANNIDLSEKNTAINKLSKKSEQFNFAKADAINDFGFNEVLWKGIKGLNSTIPSPTRGAFLKINKKKDDD